jgi:hypothetical protein
VVDPKPLLKGFGAAADVAGQIATDKAINSRRQSKGSTSEDARIEGLGGGVDITDGQLIENHDLSAGTPYIVPHNLGRVPVGAIVLKQDVGTAAEYAVDFTIDTIEMSSNSVRVSLWVF